MPASPWKPTSPVRRGRLQSARGLFPQLLGLRLLALLVFVACAVSVAATVLVENSTGNITVRVVMGAEKAQVTISSPTRPRRPDDVKFTQESGSLLVQCQPSDGARLDLDITIPHSVDLEATTTSGAISIQGLVRRASLVTDSGDICIQRPLLRRAPLEVTSSQRPKNLSLPKSIRYDYRKTSGMWTLRGPAAMPPPAGVGARAGVLITSSFSRGGSWSEVSGISGPLLQVKARALGRFELVDEPLPADSWYRTIEQARSTVEALLKAPGTRVATPGLPSGTARASAENGPAFVSNVRMVSLLVPVRDRDRRPLPGLTAADFEVTEDGVRQRLASVSADEVPFNLALLLDLSSTTITQRSVMLEAARQFIRIARPEDKVAVYALADGAFQVVCPLTQDRERLARFLDRIPPTGGASPIYQAIAFSYAQESLHLSPERSALVVISDGVDLRFVPDGMQITSEPIVGINWYFDHLKPAVAGLPVLLYPIQLPVPTAFSRSESTVRSQMRQLAEASGGQVFQAQSLESLAPVYSQVAEELRSVYTIAYYPGNQNFDGKWRKIAVRVRPAGATLRTRNGYYAR